jgi:hypothetical protein
MYIVASPGTPVWVETLFGLVCRIPLEGDGFLSALRLFGIMRKILDWSSFEPIPLELGANHGLKPQLGMSVEKIDIDPVAPWTESPIS